MSAPHHGGYAGNMSDYHDYDQYNSYPRHNPRSPSNNRTRIPGPSHTRQRSMSAEETTLPGRSAPSARRNQEERHYPEESAWETSQNLYNGVGYEEDYGAYDQYSQWPLPDQSYEQPPRGNPSPRRIPSRPQRPGDSPQRSGVPQQIRGPPRSFPNAVNATRQHHQPYPQQPMSHHGNGRWTGNGYDYAPPHNPPPSRPPPQYQYPRQSPSPIPQYPQPQLPSAAAYARVNNQRAPLGPPPSARRGPAAYYPDLAPVHPIVEETDSMRSSLRNGSVRTGGHDSKTSLASSNAIPIGIPQVYLDNHTGPQPSTTQNSSIPEDLHEVSDPDDDDANQRLPGFERVIPPNRDQESPEVMVRQASLGKKSRPTLTQVRSGLGSTMSSGSDQALATRFNSQRRKGSRDIPNVTAEAERTRALTREKLEGQTEAGAPNDEQNSGRGSSPTVSEVAVVRSTPGESGSRTPEDVLKSGTGLLDASDSDDGNALRRKKSKELLGTAITQELHPQRSQPRSPLAPSNQDRVASIIDSLEKGGAITSKDAEELKKPTGGLSEKREKRRPPKLDVGAVRDAEARGSLTSLPDLILRATKLASNLDRGRTASRLGMNWFDGANDNEKRRSGSISDALNSFPLPYNATPPPGSRGDLRKSMMSASHQHSVLPSESDPGEARSRRRPCCGMPLWLFVLLIVVLLLLVAAAVVLPVVFVVLPSENKHQSSNALSSCQSQLTCENGGANILSSTGFCECICRNGFYGQTCSKSAVQGCTTASIGTTDNASLGEAIPRLLQGSQSNFSIPLDGQELLGLFSSSDMSCVSQNALVTFNSEASKRSAAVLPDAAPHEPLLARQSVASTMTTDGILFAAGSPTSTSTAPSSTSTSSSTDETSSSGASGSNSQIDFARVAVLYVLQTTGNVSTAATAQEKLQSYFSSEQTNSPADIDASNVTLGNSFSCDLTTYSIELGNGTTVGG